MNDSQHVPSALMRQTLLDRDLVRPAAAHSVIRLLPWLQVVVLGGRSIIDKGRDVVLPVVDELREALGRHRLLITTGPGIRARHAMGIALDLGLPTGVLATLASTDAEQNGHLVAALLAEQGVSYLPHAAVGHQLAGHLAAAPAVVSNGYPPYELYEFPPHVGKLPEHGTDAGSFLIADAYGAKQIVYVKDVDGICTHDPAAGEGELIPRVGANELREMELPTLPIDPIVLELMAVAKHEHEIQIVNGTTPGNIAAALRGEHVGTIVHKDT